jgi:hypothetical protein
MSPTDTQPPDPVPGRKGIESAHEGIMIVQLEWQIFPRCKRLASRKQPPILVASPLTPGPQILGSLLMTEDLGKNDLLIMGKEGLLLVGPNSNVYEPCVHLSLSRSSPLI